MTKFDYINKVANANNNIRKGFILLGKDLQKYTRVGGQRLTGKVKLYNHWLDIDVVLTQSEYDYIVKNLGNTGYNRFAR